MEKTSRWELLNPEGIIQIKPEKLNSHPCTLEDKTVLLRWNGKHNGNLFLNRISELLKENVKGVKIIKAWEAVPETMSSSFNTDVSKLLARKLAELSPDIAIGAPGD